MWCCSCIGRILFPSLADWTSFGFIAKNEENVANAKRHCGASLAGAFRERRKQFLSFESFYELFLANVAIKRKRVFKALIQCHWTSWKSLDNSLWSVAHYLFLLCFEFISKVIIMCSKFALERSIPLRLLRHDALISLKSLKPSLGSITIAHYNYN